MKDGSPGFSDHPSKEFLEVARRLRVGVTPDDRGTISADDWPEFSYWIEDDLFLNLYLRTELGGNREINTRIHLDKNEWVVLGGLRREDQNSEILEYLVAVRLTLTDLNRE